MGRKTSKSKNILKSKLLIILFVYLLIVIPLFLYKTQGQKVSQSPQASSTDIFDKVAREIQKERYAFLSEPEFKNEGSTWWISNDGWSLDVPTSREITAKVLPQAEDRYDETNTYALRNLQMKVRDYMVKNGFTLNVRNSTTSKDDTQAYGHFQSYEKDDVKCQSISSHYPSYGDEGTPSYYTFSFTCFSQSAIEQAYNEQVPFLKGLYNGEKVEVIVTNIKIDGDQASMSIYWRVGGGAQAFMYKDSNEWKKIVIAQEVPMCSEMQQNGVPEKYWPNCYLEDRQTIREATSY